MRQSFNVAKTINETVKVKRLYQKYVAEKSGFTEQQFSDMLNGRKVIRAEYLPQIANALGVSIGDLFVDTGQSTT